MFRALCLSLLLALVGSLASAAEITAEKNERGVVIKIDGKFFTEYLTRSGAKPILWPIETASGKQLTRKYPMIADAPGEERDHPHQRSFFFTHGSVNGVDFWSEVKEHGTIEHREFVKVEGGKEATIVTRNDWLDHGGKKQLEDERTLKFGTDGDRRWIDFDIVFKATQGQVVFGDTKEGSFGLRMASSIRVDSKKTDPKLGGQIVNSDGLTDQAAWGKPAAWVDYHGPVDDETWGIAILNHPSSFRFPTYWHVRTYGLFAANPFGLNDFTKEKDGTYTLPSGEKMALRYRVLLHKGNEKEGKVAEAYTAYSKLEKK